MLKPFNKNLLYFFILVVFTTGCFTMKYDAKGGVTIDPKLKTFSVQYFENRATLVQPSFSQNFTESLREYIEKNTGLRYVTGVGDVDFSGKINTYEYRPQVLTSGESTTIQNRFTISIEVTYSNTIDSKSDFKKSFSYYKDYSGEFTSIETEYSEEIMNDLIEQTFNAAFVNW